MTLSLPCWLISSSSYCLHCKSRLTCQGYCRSVENRSLLRHEKTLLNSTHLQFREKYQQQLFSASPQRGLILRKSQRSLSVLTSWRCSFSVSTMQTSLMCTFFFSTVNYSTQGVQRSSGQSNSIDFAGVLTSSTDRDIVSSWKKLSICILFGRFDRVYSTLQADESFGDTISLLANWLTLVGRRGLQAYDAGLRRSPSSTLALLTISLL